MKAIAAASGSTPESVNAAIEGLFLHLAKGASAGQVGALRQLRLLQKAIVDREEQGETLSRLLPGGLAEKLRNDRDAVGRTERLEVTVLMSDVRGYSAIAERSDPTVLAGQLQRSPCRDEHRDPRRGAAPSCSTSATPSWRCSARRSPRTIMPTRRCRRRSTMHRRQIRPQRDRGTTPDCRPFGLGIGSVDR